jgi:hypothetical protein
MRKHSEHRRDVDEELTTEIPTAPNRDLGTGGTKEVDGPRNTDDLHATDDLGDESVPEPPD